MSPEVQHPVGRQVAHCWSRHLQEMDWRTRSSIVVDNQGKFDGQQLHSSLSDDQHQNHNFFGHRHFQLLEHVFQDEADLGATAVEQEEPGEKREIDDAEQDAEDIVGHGVPIQANDMYRFAIKAHVAEDQAIENGDSHPHDIEYAKTDANDAEVIGEVGRVGLVPQQVMHRAANEHHGRIQPKGSIPTSTHPLHIVVSLEVSEEPSRPKLEIQQDSVFDNLIIDLEIILVVVDRQAFTAPPAATRLLLLLLITVLQKY